MIVTPEQAYKYALAKYPNFPSDWNITDSFTWNEAFLSETKIGCPTLNMFKTILKSALEFQKARNYIGKPFTITNWFRSQAHNQRLLDEYNMCLRKGIKCSHDKPAMHSAHTYGMAVDFNVSGMTPEQVRVKLLKGVKEGKLKLRIEAGRPAWTHIDIGQPYLNNYVWGLFQP